MYYEEFTPGLVIPLAEVTVEREEMLDFARRYNPSPVHVDEEFARTTVHGDIIAPGSFSEALVHRAYVEAGITGREAIGGKSVFTQWKKPVFAGDILSSEAEVIQRESHHPDRGSVKLKITSRNQRGETVMYITTHTVVKKREADS